MKTCAVMVAIWMKPDVLGAARRIAKYFEKLNEMPLRFIVGTDLRGEFLSAASYAKYYAWRLVEPNVERIVYLDCDMFPVRPLPELPAADFAAAPDIAKNFELTAKHWPVIQRAGTYFNAGFFVATRKTEPIFNRMILRQNHIVGSEMPWHVDQSFFNVEVFSAVEAGDITYESLPKSWNNLILTDPEPVDDPYMLHLTGGDVFRLRIIDHVIAQLGHLERAKRLMGRVQQEQPRGK